MKKMKRFLLIFVLVISSVLLFAIETKTSPLEIQVPVSCTSNSILGLTDNLETAKAFSSTEGNLSSFSLTAQGTVATGTLYLYFYVYGSDNVILSVDANQILWRLKDDNTYTEAFAENQIDYEITFDYDLGDDSVWMCSYFPDGGTSTQKEAATANTSGYSNLRRKGICKLVIKTDSLVGKAVGSKYKGKIVITLTNS